MAVPASGTKMQAFWMPNSSTSLERNGRLSLGVASASYPYMNRPSPTLQLPSCFFFDTNGFSSAQSDPAQDKLNEPLGQLQKALFIATWAHTKGNNISAAVPSRSSTRICMP